MSERQELRSLYRRKRRALARHAQQRHAAAVARRVACSGLLLSSKRIGAYFAADGEVDLTPTIARLAAMGKHIAVPVIRPHFPDGTTMEFYRYRLNDALVLNRYNIPEPKPGAAFVPPATLDLLLLPLVAFDEYGVRLGMGGGYYDRFLGQLDPAQRPRLVGVAHEVQRSQDPLPFDRWDVPLTDVVTEAGWQSFA